MIENKIMYNGVAIPPVGFGTWQSPDNETTINAVYEAINIGYRHIDAAAAYRNEKSVGEGIKRSGIARSDIFITSKLWNTEHGYDSTLRAFDKTINDLGVDYLDLYLIHWPITLKDKNNWIQANLDTWRAFEKLYKEKRIRSIGVSNFKQHHLEPLMEKAEVMPMINQIEIHPSMNQEDTIAFCRMNNMLVEAWSPLSSGRIFDNKEINTIAAKYGKTVSQVVLRWHLQRDVIPLPKSVTPSRIVENFDIFDFELDQADMEFISKFRGCVGSGLDPDTHLE